MTFTDAVNEMLWGIGGTVAATFKRKRLSQNKYAIDPRDDSTIRKYKEIKNASMNPAIPRQEIEDDIRSLVRYLSSSGVIRLAVFVGVDDSPTRFVMKQRIIDSVLKP